METSATGGSSTGGAPADTSTGTPPTDVGDESTTTGDGGELHPRGRYVVTSWEQTTVLSLAVGTYDGVVHDLLPLAPVGALAAATGEGDRRELWLRLVDLTAPDDVPTIAEMVTGAEFIPG